MKSINIELATNIYQQIENLQKTLLSNENKANELRKLFESLIEHTYKYDNSSYTPLSQLFYEYTQKSDKRQIYYVGKELIKNLNNWSHHTKDILDDKDLVQYFSQFKGIVNEITGVDDTYTVNKKFKKFTLDDLRLNSKQLSAVRAKEKIVLVNAGPGTGKTYLIVGRILESISNDHEKKIFALSFTNKAANELQERVDKELFGTNISSLRSNILIGTIHSFSLYIIKKYFKIQNIAFEYSVIDEFEYNEIKINLDNEIVIGEYLSENKLLTFDGIVTKFIEMLGDDYNFQEFLKSEMNEIIIDEAQDLDKNQYEILKLINEKVPNNNLFFVGDQRQNIYAFKGGSLSHFQNLIGKKVYKEVILDLSYRCPQNILNFVNKISFNDSNNNKLVNALNNKGNNLEILTFEDKKAEAHGIVQLIKKNVESKKYNDIAIIFTNSFYFKEISDSLNENKIPFKLFGGQNYLDRNIRHLRNILNAIYKDDSYSLSSVGSFWSKMKMVGKNILEVFSGLIAINIKALAEFEVNNLKTLALILNFIKNNNKSTREPTEIIDEFILYCREEKLFEPSIIELFNEFSGALKMNGSVKNFDDLKLALSPNNPDFKRFYFRSDSDVVCEYPDNESYVTLTTIHSAKGLEWENVIIPGMSKDSFPRYFKFPVDEEAEMPNEIKKFYVACTRSKRRLFFTRANYNQYGYKKDISSFVNNIDEVKIDV